MKRISIVVGLLLCLLVGCASQGTAVKDVISDTIAPQNDAGVIDGISNTKEKGINYTVFDCNGVLFGSKDDENTWWQLIVEDSTDFNNLRDGEFAYCSLNTRVEDGGIAGIHEITVEKVNSCGRCTIEDVKRNKGDLFMQYDFEHPYVAGVSYYDDYVIAQIIGDSYYVYQSGVFIANYEDLDKVTALLSGNTSIEEKTESVLDDDTKALYKQYEYEGISVVLDSEEFNNADEETRIAMMLDCMETLYGNGYIESYSIPDNDVVTYTDIYGMECGVKVRPFEEGMN